MWDLPKIVIFDLKKKVKWKCQKFINATTTKKLVKSLQKQVFKKNNNKESLLGSFSLAKFGNVLKFAWVLWSWLAALAMYTVHCTAKETCLAFVFSWSSDHLRLSVHFITSDWLWPSYLSGTIWDQLSPSGTISLRLGPSHSMLEHLRPLRQSLSFEGSPHGDFLRFHIHVIILIQLVYHIHIGCKSSLLSYTFSSSNSNSYSPIFT